jgi:amino acid adenylation domain-containing protein
MHHIISDGWSLNILIKEFVSLYQNEHLEELKIQYADYAAWQRKTLSANRLEEKLAFFRNELQGIEPLNLPTTYPRATTQSYRGGHIYFSIDKETTSRLNALAQKYDVTLFMLLLSSFAILLEKYTSQDKIVIGTPIANRTRVDVESLIGLFINVLPIKVDTKTQKSFVELLDEVKESTLNVYEYQDVPFEKIVEVLNLPRDTSRSPLFQAMFVLQNTNNTELTIDGLEIDDMQLENPTSKYDISMQMTPKGDEIEAELEYAVDLFSKEFIEDMAQNYQRLLEMIVKDETKQISQYQIVQKAEVLSTQEREFSNKTLHQIIEEQVEKSIDDIAVVFEDKSLSYKELNQKANIVANYLIERGVVTEDIIALKLDRSLEMIIGILGILKARCAYLPIDINYPQNRIDYIIENSQAKEILTQEDIKTILKENSNDNNPNLPMSPDNLAYVIYTSGSTGNPKGVMLEHKGVVNRLEWQIRELNINSSDVILQKTPFSFDVSVWELLLPLMCGAKEVIAKPNGHKDSQYLAQIIKDEEITTIHFVPSMLSVINQEPLFVQNSHYLKRVVCSGEALALRLVKEYYKLHQAPIYNLYGPTEASIDVTSYKCPRDTSKLNTIPIGKAIDNIRLHILDKNLNYVPKGVVGELYIEGVGVARGYLNNPELSKKVFINHNNKRLYKTGDLVKVLPDGNIEYISRSDNQVKLRGLRIELQEIEQQLLNIKEIQEAIVVVKDDNLVAYITINENIDIEKIKEELSKTLTEYMIPSHIEILTNMPLTPNGKADRKALINKELHITSTKEYVAPRDEIEEELADIFKELLGVKQVGVYDNFFELGGHSLLATQLVSKIRAKLGVELGLKELFGLVTLEDLAKTIKTADKIDNTLSIKSSKDEYQNVLEDSEEDIEEFTL